MRMQLLNSKVGTVRLSSLPANAINPIALGHMIRTMCYQLTKEEKEKAKSARVKAKAKVKEKAKEKVKEKAKGKEKGKMENPKEKEKGRLNPVILAKSLDINHLSAGTIQMLGKDLKPSQNMMTEVSHGDPAMLHNSHLDANRRLDNLINLNANS